MQKKTFEKPIILLDKNQILRNLENMVHKAKKSGVILRPHLKTHQSHEIAEWMRPYGIEKITVSSFYMAEYFVQHGFEDVTVAVPINIHQIAQINELAGKCTLNICVENLTSAKVLVDHIKDPLNVWIEIDVGYHRTGVIWGDYETLKQLGSILKSNPCLNFSGILTHAGHSYHGSSIQDILNIYHESVERMKTVQEYFYSIGYDQLQISVGDTPTCSVVDEFDPRITEIRPGNFIFYDLTQCDIGSCKESEIALVTACPVISKNLDAGTVVIYGGGVHLSKERLNYKKRGTIYGLVAKLNKEGNGRTEPISNVEVSSLTQEHGKITGPKEFIESCQIGDILLILPVHSCMVANLHTTYYTYAGEPVKSFRME